MSSFPFGVSIERGAVRPDDSLCMHSHQYCELFFLLSGRRRYFLEHTIYEVEPMDLVIIPPAQLHRTVQTGAAGYERYLVNFYAEDHAAFIRAIGPDGFHRILSGGCVCFSPDEARHLR